MEIILKAKAKINIYLHIVGKLPNNYHNLDSHVAFASDLYDEIILKSSSDLILSYHGSYASLIPSNPREDFIYTSLEKLYSDFPHIDKFEITIKKNIPVGAGLGGGSSDLAVILNYLIRTYKITIPNLEQYLLIFGSDIPVCYNQESGIFKGQGSFTTPKVLSYRYAIIVYPNIVINSKEIFSRFSNLSLSIKDDVSNHLQAAAQELYPKLKDFADKLESALINAKSIAMSGSGSSFFALYERELSAIQDFTTLNSQSFANNMLKKLTELN